VPFPAAFLLDFLLLYPYSGRLSSKNMRIFHVFIKVLHEKTRIFDSKSESLRRFFKDAAIP
jgi:hypothetical protein